MLPQQYCLKWKYHNNNIQFTFSQLLEKGSFCDVTLWCGGVAFRAHRAVLAACSPLLGALLGGHADAAGPCGSSEPSIVLERTEARHLTMLMAFMYTGEVSVHYADLPGLLKTAEDLQIKGLADVMWKEPSGGVMLPGSQVPVSRAGVGVGVGVGTAVQNVAGQSNVAGLPPPATKVSSVTQTQYSGMSSVAQSCSPAVSGKSTVSSQQQYPPVDENDIEEMHPVQPIMVAVNGSLVVPPLAMLSQPQTGSDAVKRRRGRPPLEPQTPTESEMKSEHSSPKRAKMPPLAPIKSADGGVTELPIEWAGMPSSHANDEAEELSSEYSEASLDGRDISQFLDTTMEVDGSAVDSHNSEQQQAEAHAQAITQQAQVITQQLLLAQVAQAAAQAAQAAQASATIKTEAPVVSVKDSPGKASEKVSTTDGGGGSAGSSSQFADVIKLSDYLQRGRRPQFWAEDFVKRVMEAVFSKELEMKQAAEMLGVSYGTLYGRYRDCFGCINRPYRASEILAARTLSDAPSLSFTPESSRDILKKLQSKEITIYKAAELLNVTPQTLTSYLISINDPQARELSDSEEDNLHKAGKNLEKPWDENEFSCEETSEDEVPKDEVAASVARETSPGEALMKKDEGENSQGQEAKHESWSSKEESGEDTKNEEDDDPLRLSPDPKQIKAPMIRVADLKFLKGEGKSAGGAQSVEALLKNHPDLTMVPASKRKVTFRDVLTVEPKSTSPNGEGRASSDEAVS